MALFVLSLCPFDISVGVGAFVIGLSQISSFFSLHLKVKYFDKITKSKKNLCTADYCAFDRIYDYFKISLILCNNIMQKWCRIEC